MNIAVCDDSPEFRQVLVGYIRPYQDDNSDIAVAEFSRAEDLLSSIDGGERYDVLFLDIRMEDMDGIRAAQYIRNSDDKVIIFFVTSYISFVSETFRVGAFQFLLKPLEEEDFRREFERALAGYKIRRYKYTIRWKESVSVIELRDILYIEARGRHIRVFTQNDTLECVGMISREQERLKDYGFVKSHQSYLVNLDAIKYVGNTKIQLKNNALVPVSRSLKTPVKEAFAKYILGSAI